MYQILKKQTLNANTKLMVIEAPHVARKAEPGQFIILRVSAEGERIPLTIADFDREKGSVTIIFQEVGATTMALGMRATACMILSVRSARRASLRVSRRSLLSAAVWAARSHIRRQRSCTKWALRLT